MKHVCWEEGDTEAVVPEAVMWPREWPHYRKGSQWTQMCRKCDPAPDPLMSCEEILAEEPLKKWLGWQCDRAQVWSAVGFLVRLHPSSLSQGVNLPFGESPNVCSSLVWKMYPGAVSSSVNVYCSVSDPVLETEHNRESSLSCSFSYIPSAWNTVDSQYLLSEWINNKQMEALPKTSWGCVNLSGLWCPHP